MNLLLIRLALYAAFIWAIWPLDFVRFMLAILLLLAMSFLGEKD